MNQDETILEDFCCQFSSDHRIETLTILQLAKLKILPNVSTLLWYILLNVSKNNITFSVPNFIISRFFFASVICRCFNCDLRCKLRTTSWIINFAGTKILSIFSAIVCVSISDSALASDMIISYGKWSGDKKKSIIWFLVLFYRYFNSWNTFISSFTSFDFFKNYNWIIHVYKILSSDLKYFIEFFLLKQ